MWSRTNRSTNSRSPDRIASRMPWCSATTSDATVVERLQPDQAQPGLGDQGAEHPDQSRALGCLHQRLMECQVLGDDVGPLTVD